MGEAKDAAKLILQEQHPQQGIIQSCSAEIEKPCFTGTREKYGMDFNIGYHSGREGVVGRLFTLYPFELLNS